MKLRQPFQNGVDLTPAYRCFAEWISGSIQVFQYNQHLIFVMFDGQAMGNPRSTFGTVLLVPGGFHIIRLQFSLMPDICIPASWVLFNTLSLNMFYNHTAGKAAGNTYTKDFTIAAPEFLDNFLIDDRIGSGALQYDGFKGFFHSC